MTRLAILADIHGNLPALEAVLADLGPCAVDAIAVAGDSINWGPFSAAVVERIVAEGWAVIRGNNEFYLLDYDTPRAPAAWADRSQWAALAWLRDQVGDAHRRRIAAWPDWLSLRFPDAPPLRLLHGSPRSNWEGLYPTTPADELAALLAGIEETTVVAAHTHLAMERRVAGWHLLNPGSVGVPIDGRFGASYLLLDGDASGWRPTFRRVPVDLAPVFAEFERQRFVERVGVIGALILEEYATARLRVSPFLHWRAERCPERPLTPALLDDFRQADILAYTPPAYRINLAATPAD